jgi:hypothetical protein
MQLTASEILRDLGLEGKTPAAAIVALSSLELDDIRMASVFKSFAGDAIALPPTRVLGTVVCYLVYDAAKNIALDVEKAIERANAMVLRMPWAFSDAAEQERQRLRDEKIAKNAEKEAVKVTKPAPVVNGATGEVEYVQVPVDNAPKKRGRQKAAPGESNYDKVLAMYSSADEAGRDRKVLLPRIIKELGMSDTSATVYWYKAKKQVDAGLGLA